jgi:hypothetical protein
MNDFMEIEHGFECLNSSYKAHKDRFAAIFDSMFEGFSISLEKYFNDWLPHIRADTYIACFSEHDDDEDAIGRLSMWRAYGGNTGVAVVMKNRPFLAPSDALKAYTSPVAYMRADQFDREFIMFLDRVEQNKSVVRDLGTVLARDRVFEVFRSAALCTKHPGFREEREWRVIYSPTYRKSERIVPEIVTIDGTPQLVQKIPLKNAPSENLLGIEVPELVDRIIVGPSKHPLVMRDAFGALLTKAGMPDAENRVVVSDIPLRN